MLGRLVSEIDLNEDTRSRSRLDRRPIELVEQFQAVDRFNRCERCGGAFGLVGLQMTDQMPLELEIEKLLAFVETFLNTILTKDALPGGGSLTDEAGREGLGNGNKLDFRG